MFICCLQPELPEVPAMRLVIVRAAVRKFSLDQERILG